MTRSLPESVGGWRLADSSRRSSGKGGNYEDPAKDRVFVNIAQPDVVNRPEFWRAKFNDHNGPTEEIASGTDYDAVVDAALDWMERNPVDDQSLSNF